MRESGSLRFRSPAVSLETIEIAIVVGVAGGWTAAAPVRDQVDEIGHIDYSVAVGVADHEVWRGRWSAVENVRDQIDFVGNIDETAVIDITAGDGAEGLSGIDSPPAIRPVISQRVASIYLIISGVIQHVVNPVSVTPGAAKPRASRHD